jgi:DNA-binding MarR family transcriptional regulator
MLECFTHNASEIWMKNTMAAEMSAKRMKAGRASAGRTKREVVKAPAEHAALELGPLTRSLGYHLRIVQLAYKKHFLREAASTGFSPQHVGAMYIIAQNPGVTPSQLASALAMDVAQVAVMLNSLELRGWLNREVSEADGRSRMVSLTPAGTEQFRKLKAAAARVETSFGSALSPQQVEQLIALLSLLPNSGPE